MSACVPCKLKNKWYFWPCRILRMYLDLCMMVFFSTDFYRAILNTRNINVNGLVVDGSKESTSLSPIFSQIQSEVQYLHPGHQTLCFLPKKAWREGFFPCLGGCREGSKEPVLQGLKSGLFYPEGWMDSFEAISLLYKSLLVLRITE